MVRQRTAKELRAFDCGRLANPRFADQKPVPNTRPPTLDEVFDLVASMKGDAARKVQFNIEAKTVPVAQRYSTTPERFARLIAAVIKKRKLEHALWCSLSITACSRR